MKSYFLENYRKNLLSILLYNEMTVNCLRKFVDLIGFQAFNRFLGLLFIRGKVSAERKWFEENVFCKYVQHLGPVLLIGVKSYSFHYLVCYSVFSELIVLEPNRGFEIPAKINRLAIRLEQAEFDSNSIGFVDCHGVYGYGLNDETSVRKSIEMLTKSMAKKGRFLFSINRDRDPILIYNKENRDALFSPLVEEACFVTKTGVVYVFVKSDI